MDRILRKAELLDVTGLSSATLYRWIKAGTFPAPVKLGPNSVGWRESEVQDWIDTRERAFEVPEASQPEDRTPSNEPVAAGSQQ